MAFATNVAAEAVSEAAEIGIAVAIENAKEKAERALAKAERAMIPGETKPKDRTFTTSDGQTFNGQFLLEKVAQHGQRYVARFYSIPRSTLQGWLKVLAE